jgi:hypothetical protein
MVLRIQQSDFVVEAFCDCSETRNDLNCQIRGRLLKIVKF